MTAYLMENRLYPCQLPEGQGPRFPGCMEHATMIWEHIHTTKRDKKDLHIVCLNLTIAYG